MWNGSREFPLPCCWMVATQTATRENTRKSSTPQPLFFGRVRFDSLPAVNYFPVVAEAGRMPEERFIEVPLRPRHTLVRTPCVIAVIDKSGFDDGPDCGAHLRPPGIKHDPAIQLLFPLLAWRARLNAHGLCHAGNHAAQSGLLAEKRHANVKRLRLGVLVRIVLNLHRPVPCVPFRNTP